MLYELSDDQAEEARNIITSVMNEHKDDPFWVDFVVPRLEILIRSLNQPTKFINLPKDLSKLDE